MYTLKWFIFHIDIILNLCKLLNYINFIDIGHFDVKDVILVL